MRFEWNFIKDYLMDYLKELALLTFGIFITLTGVVTLGISAMNAALSSQQ